MAMKITQLTAAFFFVNILFISCMQDEPFKLNYNGFTPISLNDGWMMSTPDQENMNGQKLDDVFEVAYRDNRFRLLRSLIVIRNGKIVAEAYPHDPNDMYQIQNVKSVAKSFTSILTGIAFQQHYLDSLSQAFSSIYPEYFEKYPEKAGITIEQALTMRTGLGLHGGDHSYNLYHSDNSIEFILSKPLYSAPGKEFFYTDDNPHLISYAIQRRYGKSLAQFADQYLFSPLGITEWQWEAPKDGVSFGGTNLYLKPRDMAKFGQMLLQNGKWQDKQIVDSAWVAEATRAQYSEQYWAYGYYFWIMKDLKAYDAAGHGGQEIIVVPYKNLVVVVTAWPYMTDTEWLRDNFCGTLLKDIIGACY
jgi:CubicO group peptidase (beta-lactamase class C family)